MPEKEQPMYKYLLLLLLLMLTLVACGGDKDETPKSSFQFAEDTAEGRGERLFKTHCATCHSVEGDRVVVGPALEGVATRAETRVAGLDAETYLYTSIIHPDEFVVEGFTEGSMQQNFADRLTTENVDDLVAYLLTLK